MNTSRPIRARIAPQAIRHNYRLAKQHAPRSRAWAVIKANAYGHGVEHAFQGLRAADGFAVLEIAEAQRLRALGWRGPILLLEGVFEPRDLELCSRLGLWHTVHCDAQIDWLAAHKTQVPHRVFLKMNSGMNRLGFDERTLPQAWASLEKIPSLNLSLMKKIVRSLMNTAFNRIFHRNNGVLNLSGFISLNNFCNIFKRQEVSLWKRMKSYVIRKRAFGS